MIIVDMHSFPGSRDHAVRSLRALLGLPERHEENHEYSLAIVDAKAGAAIELTQFEAPCPENFRAHLVRLLEVLRETADEIEAAHADVLVEDKEPADIPIHVLVDLLSVVGVSVTEERAGSWTQAQRREAEQWASATHLSASDNDVTVPERPAFLTFTGMCAMHGVWSSPYAEMCPQGYHGPDLASPMPTYRNEETPDAT